MDWELAGLVHFEAALVGPQDSCLPVLEERERSAGRAENSTVDCCEGLVRGVREGCLEVISGQERS